MNVKPAKTATHVKLEDILLTWFREVTAADVNMGGKVLREKAYNVALFLGIDNSQASGGWLHRFKEWHGLVYKVVSCEAKKMDKSQMNGSLNTLLALISNYAPCDIFNGDKRRRMGDFVPPSWSHVKTVKQGLAACLTVTGAMGSGDLMSLGISTA
nr:tigger transposable element-derived protein 6-like [Rhipicephalus microplus]